jgi:hypothetical protein
VGLFISLSTAASWAAVDSGHRGLITNYLRKNKISCCIRLAIGYIRAMKTFIRIGNDIVPEYRPHELRSMLASHDVVRVWFRKANTDVRCIRGTVKAHLIPLDKQPKGVLISNPNDQQIRMFDMEKGEWRSFNSDRLFQIEAVS